MGPIMNLQKVPPDRNLPPGGNVVDLRRIIHKKFNVEFAESAEFRRETVIIKFISPAHNFSRGLQKRKYPYRSNGSKKTHPLFRKTCNKKLQKPLRVSAFSASLR